MNDDQLGREIFAALLKDDPGAVPARLSERVASVPDEAAARRGAGALRFSRVSPMLRTLEAIAAVVVVGALVAGTLILRGSSVGQVPGSSSSASPNSSASGVVATGTQSKSQSPTPSAARPDNWTGLRWSAPSVMPSAEGISDIVYYNGQYIAAGRAGQTNSSGGQLPVGIWHSPDGTTWTQVSLDPTMFDNANLAGLVKTDTLGLIAWGTMGDPVCNGQGAGMTCGPVPVRIWTSPNGTDWSRVADMTMFKGATIQGVAYGLLGLVAVGDTGFNEPAIWVGDPGTVWQRQTLDPTVFKDAHFASISYTVDGYVIGGSTGGTAPLPGGAQPLDTGSAAAWRFYGQTWTKATVYRNGQVGTSLGGIAVGASGMVAVGPANGGKVVTGWVSSDGNVWLPVPIGGNYAGAPTSRPGVAILPANTVTGDGTHLVAQGSDGSGLHVWISSDGVTWREMPFSGATGTVSTSINQMFVVGDGLIAISGDGHSVWRVTAQP